MNDHHDMRFDHGEQMPERLRAQASRLLGMTAAQASRLAQDALASVGARRYHFAVLAALEEFGPGSQSALSDRTRIYRSDLVATLNELAEGGYVRRAPDPGDRRRNVITLTEEGRHRLAELDEITADVNERILAPLSAAEREQLFALMRRLNDHLAGGQA
ncbi:MarR family winged helix-turn-helix transcriptional regulator [Glycomyces tarimensis]